MCAKTRERLRKGALKEFQRQRVFRRVRPKAGGLQNGGEDTIGGSPCPPRRTVFCGFQGAIRFVPSSVPVSWRRPLPCPDEADQSERTSSLDDALYNRPRLSAPGTARPAEWARRDPDAPPIPTGHRPPRLVGPQGADRAAPHAVPDACFEKISAQWLATLPVASYLRPGGIEYRSS